MTAYGLAHLRTASTHADVLEYLRRIDATLAPFGGRFLVHGGDVEVLEGTWPGHLVIIEFPDLPTARAWYDSSDYQEIKPFRTRHIAGDVILADGVEPDHSSAELAASLARQSA
ncbi:uncharacterized protein (DUF1330 family) [Micromonospora profundi]|uniref:DUF1330 domain-containing protein n=1 Tax=Micromonospora profundi TaxID=1420889 RepID=UPI0014395C1B|nr:DUF1330 domain-containing protein [Micromonospora profundi]NJC11782.1 uncharacterized protein (DUF1330 family) [Micromonospora profundi]